MKKSNIEWFLNSGEMSLESMKSLIRGGTGTGEEPGNTGSGGNEGGPPPQ